MASFAQDVGRVPCPSFKVVSGHGIDVAQRVARCTSILTIYILSSQMVVALGVCPCKDEPLFSS